MRLAKDAILTAKERDVAELMAAGLARREIATELHTTSLAVKRRSQRARRRAMKKMTAVEGAVARQEAQRRYASALNPAKPPRFRPFSLLNGEA